MTAVKFSGSVITISVIIVKAQEGPLGFLRKTNITPGSGTAFSKECSGVGRIVREVVQLLFDADIALNEERSDIVRYIQKESIC